MKKLKFYDEEKIDINDLLFEEDVPDDDLYSKKTFDDHIYLFDRKKVKRKKILLTFLAMLFVLSAVSIAAIASIYMDESIKKENILNQKKKYQLIVAYSNKDHGGVLNTTNSSLNNAFSYKFYVNNSKNALEIDYFIKISSSKEVLFSKINYQLIKNERVVKEGVLGDFENNTLYNALIFSKSFDQYELKLWSDKLTLNDKFDFKIDVKV